MLRREESDELDGPFNHRVVRGRSSHNVIMGKCLIRHFDVLIPSGLVFHNSTVTLSQNISSYSIEGHPADDMIQRESALRQKTQDVSDYNGRIMQVIR